jgi:HEAT repeat protein
MNWRAGIVLASIAAAAFFFFQQPPDPLCWGRRVSAWGHDLLSADALTQARSAVVLKEIGAPAAPQLGKLLREREPDLPPQILAMMRKVPFWKQRAGDSEMIRARVTAVLEAMGPEAAPALPDIIPLLEDLSETVAQDTQHLLRRIGPTAGLALAHAAVKGPEAIRVRSTYALRDFAGSDESKNALKRALKDKSEFVRAAAAESLGKLGIGAKEELTQSLSDPSARVRAAASGALGELNARSAATELTARLRDASPAVQLQAAKALWNFNHDANEVLPTFVRLLNTEESWRAAYALSQMRDTAAPAVPALIRAMRREIAPRPFRSPPSVTFALGHIGPPAIPALIETLHDKNPLLRLNAAMALGIMEETAAPATPALLELASDHDTDVRQAVALALGAIGSNNPRAINSLAECLHAEDIFVRSTAMTYLRKVAPQTEWAGSTD